MTIKKPQPKDDATTPGRRDDLTLDPETVKDLEPNDGVTGQVQGGIPVTTGTRRCGGGRSG